MLSLGADVEELVVEVGSHVKEVWLWPDRDSEAGIVPDIDCCKLKIVLGTCLKKLGCVPESMDVRKVRLLEMSRGVSGPRKVEPATLLEAVSEGTNEAMTPLLNVTLDDMIVVRETMGSPSELLGSVEAVSDGNATKVLDSDILWLDKVASGKSGTMAELVLCHDVGSEERTRLERPLFKGVENGSDEVPVRV